MGKKMIFYFCFNKFKLNSDLYPGAIIPDTADIEWFLLLKNNNNNNSVPWDTTGHTELWKHHEGIGHNAGLGQCCLMEHHDPVLLLPMSLTKVSFPSYGTGISQTFFSSVIKVKL